MVKLFLFSVLSLLFASTVEAAQELSRKEVLLPVDISSTTMRLSSAGYSSPIVKILVPELAIHTILNHRNVGESAPCMATYDTFNPSDVIANDPRVEEVFFEIILEKDVYKDKVNNICKIFLKESVNANIRGFKFKHYRSQEVEKRHIDDCM